MIDDQRFQELAQKIADQNASKEEKLVFIRELNTLLSSLQEELTKA